MAADMKSIEGYVHVNFTGTEQGVEVLESTDNGSRPSDNSNYTSADLEALEASGYIDVNVTNSEDSVRVFDNSTSFLNVNLTTTEQNTGVIDSPRAVAMFVTRDETHVVLTRRESSNCPAGEWQSASTLGVEHASNARHLFLYSGIREDVQDKWLTQSPAIDGDLKLDAYKYDDLKTDNDYVGFYFLRVCAGSFYLYCLVGLKRREHNPPELKKVSSEERDIC